MARAYPKVTAIEDSSIGLSGGHLRVPYIVEIDEVGDDPFEPLIAVAPHGGSIPVGPSEGALPSWVGRRFFGLVCTDYEFPRLLNEKHYEVYVVFGPSSNRTIGLWRRSVRFASETRAFAWSLPELDQNGNITAGGMPKRVGTNEYEPVKAPAPYAAGNQPLNRTGFFRDAGLSVNDGLTAILYEILVPQLTLKQIRALTDLKWHTNEFEWLGYPPWTLIFSNWDCHDEVLVLPGSRPVVQWYSNVQIEILYRSINKAINPFGWRAVELYDFFEKGSGVKAPVTYIGSGAGYVGTGPHGIQGSIASAAPPTGKQIAKRLGGASGTVTATAPSGSKPVGGFYIQYHQTPFTNLFGVINNQGPLV